MQLNRARLELVCEIVQLNPEGPDALTNDQRCQ